MLILKIIEAWLFINIDIFNDLVILSLVTVSCTLLQIYLMITSVAYTGQLVIEPNKVKHTF